MPVIQFPKNKRGCCEMMRGPDDTFVGWCDQTPTRKASYTPMDMVGGEIVKTNPTEIIEKFWCESHAPEWAETI